MTLDETQCSFARDGTMPKLFRRMEDQEYNGVDGYLRSIVGLSDADLEQIRINLQVKKETMKSIL